MTALRRFAFVVLGWNIVTILLGSVVRATGSGAGCGPSWPTCLGEVVPELSGATAVEFSHRAVSGVALVLVAVLAFWTFRSHGLPPAARKAAFVAAAAILVEALIGAMIVLAEWVADDASVARAIAVPLHLVNTFLLLGALTATVALVGGTGSSKPFAGLPASYWLIGGGMVAVAATGAVTALADTLFPKDEIGLTPGGEHFLTGLRVVHPLVAVLVGGWAVGWIRTRGAPVDLRNGARRLVSGITWLVAGQVVLGASNVLLGTPIVVSVIHLLVADVLWIAWVLWGVESPISVSVPVESVDTSKPSSVGMSNGVSNRRSLE